MQEKRIGIFSIAAEADDSDSAGLYNVDIVRPDHGPNAIWFGSFYGDASAAASGWRHGILTYQPWGLSYESDDDDELLILNDFGDLDGIPLVRGDAARVAYYSDDLDEVWAVVRAAITEELGKPVPLTLDEAYERDWSHEDFVERTGVAEASELEP